MSMPLTAKELFRSRQRRADKKVFAWRGKRTWEVAQADLLDAETAAWDEDWTIHGVTIHATEVHAYPNETGLAKMVVFYDCKWDPTFFSVGRATIALVRAKGGMKWKERTSVNQTSTVVDNGTSTTTVTPRSVTGEPDEDGFIYRIDVGPKAEATTVASLELYTAVDRDDFTLASVMANIDKVNALEFLGFPAGSVCITGVQIPGYSIHEGCLNAVPVVYELGYTQDPEGWPTTLTVEKYKKTVVGMPVERWVDGAQDEYYSDDWQEVGIADAKYVSTARTVKVVGESFTVDIRKSDEAIFSEFEELLSWTN